MIKRIIIAVIIFGVVIAIPIGGGILYGFDWQTYGWWIFVAALAMPILIDQYRLRKKK